MRRGSGRCGIEARLLQGFYFGFLLCLMGIVPGAAFGQTDVWKGGAGNWSDASKWSLNLTLINNFVPAVGNTFTILTCSARTGQFATVNGRSINSSEHFQINYGATNVTAVVMSGP